MEKQDIIQYYNDNKKDYKLLWRLEKVWGIHFGYWEKGDKSLKKAILKMNDQIIEHVKIDDSSYILDAGCGYCGTAMYIAKKTNCKIEAITIVEEQVTTAKDLIKKDNLEKNINVTLQDYMNTNFSDNTFDVIYAVESSCYAEKDKFLKECYRILKPSGTLIILDGFNSKEEYTQKESNILKKWSDGWAFNNLATGNYFSTLSEKIGYKNAEYTDITANTINTAKFLYLSSYPAYVVDFFGRVFKTRTKYNTGNVVAARYQYIGMKKGLWEYGMFIATK